MAQTIGDINFDTTERIGQGGLGHVFKGSYGKKVAAIKRVRCVEGFQDNWATIKELSGHEHIVKYYGYEIDDNFQ